MRLNKIDSDNQMANISLNSKDINCIIQCFNCINSYDDVEKPSNFYEVYEQLIGLEHIVNSGYISSHMIKRLNQLMQKDEYINNDSI